MTDKMTPEQRHRCMSNIHSRNTGPEMVVRRWLWREGYRYRLNYKGLPGKPDIVLPRYSTVIFVNGCFWHAHEGCDKYRVPLTNVDFWAAKFKRNRERDDRNYKLLHKLGWHVLVVWECQLSSSSQRGTLMALSRRISQIYLSSHKVSLYNNEETNSSIPLAAEPTAEYGTH